MVVGRTNLVLLKGAQDTDAGLARLAEEADDLAGVRLALDVLFHIHVEQTVRLRDARVPVQLDTLPAHHLAAGSNVHHTNCVLYILEDIKQQIGLL